MKKLLVLPFLAALAMSAAHVTTQTVDTAASTASWTAYKVTGQHNGGVKLKGGSLQMDHGALVGGSFEIDMTSITCADLQGEWGDKLVGHIKSADFFDVEKFSTAKFVITRAIPIDTKGNYRIVGNLTIKEATKEIKFNANLVTEGSTTTATATMKIDRSDYGVKYGSGSFFDNLGDKTIYDEFDFAVKIVAKG